MGKMKLWPISSRQENGPSIRAVLNNEAVHPLFKRDVLRVPKDEFHRRTNDKYVPQIFVNKFHHIMCLNIDGTCFARTVQGYVKVAVFPLASITLLLFEGAKDDDAINSSQKKLLNARKTVTTKNCFEERKY